MIITKIGFNIAERQQTKKKKNKSYKSDLSFSGATDKQSTEKGIKRSFLSNLQNNIKISFEEIMNKHKSKVVWKTIKNADSCLILVHENPDGDALGSGFALYDAIKKHFPQKRVEFYINGSIPSFMQNNPNNNKLSTENPHLKKPKLAIALDCDKTNMAGYSFFKNAKERIYIDHHISNKREKGVLSIIKPKAISTTAVLYNYLFKPQNIELNSEIAESLLIGISTDSGHFSHTKEGDLTYKTWDDLINSYNSTEYPLRQRVSDVFTKKPKNNSKEIKELEHVLAEECKRNVVKTNDGKQINYIVLKQRLLNQLDIHPENTEIKRAIVSSLNQAPESDAGIFFWEHGDSSSIYVGLRSSIFDVSSFAQHNNGGGHPGAAGFKQFGNIDMVVEEVLKKIKEHPFIKI